MSLVSPQVPNFKEMVLKKVKKRLNDISGKYDDGCSFVSEDGVDERSLIMLRPAECAMMEHHSIHVSKYAINQQCHAVAAYEWLEDPTQKFIFGFSYIDSAWYMHSFLKNSSGRIIEPTPLVRDIYWGREYSLAETKFLVAEELNKMRDLDRLL